ncbi:MAG: class I tRNA ligase family protein [Verrucomicrobiota bacterium]
MNKAFYITTAIDYVNGHPHLGHAYEKVITDVIARGRRALGEETYFLTGLDEHGQKVQQAAQAAGKAPQAYCDELAAAWQSFAAKLNLTNNEFIRTTQPRHKQIVQAILSKLHDQGDFYKAEYRGFYSTKEETFLTEKDRRPDGTFDPVYGDVVELVEFNWYFRLGQHQQWLMNHIEQNPDFIAPTSRRNEVLGFLRNETLGDLCISRPAARLSWGIPLPFDPEYVTYVWFDALSNYATLPGALGDPAVCEPLGLKPEDALNNTFPSDQIPPKETILRLPKPRWPGDTGVTAPAPHLWPADIHVIGKDIVKFHTVYWPIMLKAMGLPLPKQVLVHGWWQKDNQKMSKSSGNVVDPVAVIDDWGVDPFRFYVVRELAIGPDGNWTDAGFASRYASELANGLGNLVNRSLSMLKRYRQGVVPARHDELAAISQETLTAVMAQLRDSDLQEALITIWKLVTRANQYVDQTAPFKLAKDPAQAQRLDEVLYNLVETCRVLAVLLTPFLPGTATKIYAQLALPGEPRLLTEASWGGIQPGHTIGEVQALFPRRDQPAK